jgi:hypothetical protein
MDGYSRKSWKYLHDIWFDVTYMNTKPSVEAITLSDEMVEIPIENDDEWNDMKRMKQAMKGVK